MQKLFVFLLLITSGVDLINGFLIQSVFSTPISIGQIYRLIMLLISFYIIFNSRNDKIKIYMYFLFFYFVISNLLTGYIHGSFKVLFNDLINVSKLIFTISVTLAGVVLIKEKKLKKDDIISIILINMRVISISLVVCKLFNLGFNVYTNDVGFKGYFFSNNELSIVLSIGYIYLWEFTIMKKINGEKILYKYLFDLFLVFISLMLIGAKTSYIIIFSILGLTFLRVLVKFDFEKLKKLGLILLLLIVTSIVILGIYSNEFMMIIDKQLYFLQNKDIISFILSDRNYYWDIAIRRMIEPNQQIFNYMLGFRERVFGNTTFYNIEMDLHAIFLNFGFIGLIFILTLYINIFKKITKDFLSIYPLIIILFFSITAGHVLFGAFAGTFLALQSCYAVAKFE